jgi:phytoene dehydrogenase-like protein
MPSCDAIILGGGTNGLAAATRLAQKGLKVTLLEAKPTLGGALPLTHTLRGIDARVMQGMDLERHGLTFHPALATTLLGGPPLTVQRGKTTGSDAAAFAALHAKLTDFARVLAPFRQMTPPRLTTQNDWPRLARHLLGIRALGQADFREFLRMILINIADVAEDELADDRLKGLLAFDATLGAWAGPRSPNTLILLLNQLAIGPDILVPKGGMGQIATAMETAARAAGVTIHLNTTATEILIEDDRATGVQAGVTFRAPLILSALSPRITLQNLVGPRHLDAGFFNRTHFIRSRGATAKLTLTLAAPPDLPDLRHRYVIAPSVNAVENAFNPVKYGEVPADPVLEFILPSAFDPGDAHTLTANVQFAPHDPKAGLDHARAEMLANTLETLSAHVPDLKILDATLLMPQDIESQYGMVGGNWHHGELAVEQMLFLRPMRDAAQYQTPIPGLYLASAGSHPGGGITGSAGWNAANQVLS